MTAPKVVGIGGGHGLAQTLRAVRRYASEVSAVVTVADDGGSSGRLTRELGIPAPGDIRNCLVALSDDAEVAALFQHRFARGALTGHTAGNIVIAALTERLGDFSEAVAAAGRMLGSQGRVFPATTTRVELGARTGGGDVTGQVAVARSSAPIEAVYLRPNDAPACRGAVEALLDCDQVVLGPGSLFTSLIATVLIGGVRHALQEARAQKVFVCNNRMQKGETEGLDARAHLDALIDHVGPGCVDVVIVQSPVLPADGVSYDRAELEALGVRVLEADISDATGAHDPDRLGDALARLAREASSDAALE